MTNSNNFAETTIVAFHIGRGGQFWNAGHVSFIGEKKIGEFTGDLFETYENANEIAKKIGARENLNDVFEKAIYGNQNAIDFINKIGLDLGQKVYVDGGGNEVGLTEAEEVSGIGRIDIDGQYNTTYTRYLSDCSDQELRLIAEYHGYVDSNIRDYAKEQSGIVDEEIETEE